jgi:hypothetical protein
MMRVAIGPAPKGEGGRMTRSELFHALARLPRLSLKPEEMPAAGRGVPDARLPMGTTRSVKVAPFQT